MTSSERLMEIAERLSELGPVRTYPQRGATLIAGLVGAHSFRLDRPDNDALSSESALTTTEPTISLPLRQGRTLMGTLHLEIVGARFPSVKEALSGKPMPPALLTSDFSRSKSRPFPGVPIGKMTRCSVGFLLASNLRVVVVGRGGLEPASLVRRRHV